MKVWKSLLAPGMLAALLLSIVSGPVRCGPRDGASTTERQRIDRRALVERHNVTLTRPDPLNPLSVGNGGLLTAVAMMAAGWDGCPQRHAPGFPDNGKWNIRWEGLRQMP